MKLQTGPEKYPGNYSGRNNTMEIMIIQILTVIILILLVIISFFYYLYRKKSFWLRALILRSFYNPLRLLMMHMRKADAGLFMDLKVRCLEEKFSAADEELESLCSSFSKEEARLILASAIRAKAENIPADIAFFRSRIRSGIDIRQLLEHKILADKIGADTDLEEIAAHELAGGSIRNVMEALSIASKTDEPIDFQTAAALDLAGGDIRRAARDMIHPRLVRTEKISAVAKDGFRVSARARVTIRTDPEQLIGGAGEETILSRTEEALRTVISNTEKHQTISESPGTISEAVWQQSPDKNTAYTIMSLELSEIEIGENVGLQQKMQRAREEKEIARAEIERKEQELQIRMLETQAKYLEADAKIPSAMSEAFENGKLGFADYYKMRKLKPVRDIRNTVPPGERKESVPPNHAAHPNHTDAEKAEKKEDVRN